MAIDTNNYYNFFRFSTSGLDINNPVQQYMGLSVEIPTGYSSNFKFSNDLTMMANITMTAVDSDSLLIYQFDNATAALSNIIKVYTGDQTVYDICFSPDNTKLYASTPVNGTDFFINSLWQYDLSNYNLTSIVSSKTVIYSDSIGLSHFQNGPDGKIYMARISNSFIYGNIDSLAVINNPNIQGLACNFQLNAIYLGGKQSLASLPNFDQGYFYPLLNNTCAIGINDIMIEDFKIYPNPATEYVIIENTQGFQFEIEMIDINGKKISVGKINPYEKTTLNINDLNSGIYILQLKNDNNLINLKLIKNEYI